MAAWWKRGYYETSARVSLLLYVPGASPGSIQTPVELADLFPTACELAGIETPEGLDGESLCTFTNGRPDGRRRRIARSLLLGGHPSTRFRMARDERWKLVEFPDAVTCREAKDEMSGTRRFGDPSSHLRIGAFRRAIMISPADDAFKGVFVCVLLGMGLSPVALGEKFIVRDGQPRGEIVTAQQPPRMVEFAARELQTYVAKVSGA